MPKEKQFAVLKLSAEAQGIVHKMLDRKQKAPAIAKAVLKRTGEKISWQSIAPYATHYASRQQPREIARQRTDALIGRARKQGCEISEVLRAALFEAVTQAFLNGSHIGKDLIQLEVIARKQIELAIREKQVALANRRERKRHSLAERRIKVFEERWKFDHNKAQAAIDQLDHKARKGESLSIEDVNQIREIYGLGEITEREWQREEEELRTLESEKLNDDAEENINPNDQTGNIAAR